MSGSENNEESNQKLDKNNYIEEMAKYSGERHKLEQLDYTDRMVIVFALGRCYNWCQFSGQEHFGQINKERFKQVAEKMGAELTNNVFQ
jgi:hypothetical protein